MSAGVRLLAGIFAAVLLTMTGFSEGAAVQANYDESKIPQYTLPDALTCGDGTRVTDAGTWTKKRRPEIVRLFETYVYGRSPGKPHSVKYDIQRDGDALGGKAIRKQVLITIENNGKTVALDMLIYLPKGASSGVPVFLGLNFSGNHSVSSDPGIRLGSGWMRNAEGNKSSEDQRGTSASRWPIEKIIGRGYGVATIYYGDIDPDFDDGFQNGVHPLFYDRGQTAPRADEWGSIAAWAWGLSRGMDYFETDSDIDHNRVMVMGHSRLGKTALWAGAKDERFAMVISNDSGCGGAALSRRAFGETVGRINTSFPHWFCDNFNKYNGNESECPVDQHMLIALIAPRPVCIASAQEDQWADPKGEFLSALNADDVYRLLTHEGINTRQMPDIDKPSLGRISHHIRTGKHDVTDFDWAAYMDAADRYVRKK